MLTRLTRIQLAIFAAVTVITVTAIAVAYLHVPAKLGLGSYRVSAEFVTGGGIYRNANVTYRGVKVGSVREIRLSYDRNIKDVVMPVINGHELCAQLRRVQQLSHTSIVMLTSADGLFDRARAKLSGATSFLSKPVTTDKVLGELVRHQHNQVVMVRD